MVVFYILVVADVAANRRVSRLGNIYVRIRVTLSVSTAINGLLDHFPTEIVVR